MPFVMRPILVALAVIVVLAFQSSPAQADDVTPTVTSCGAGCVDVNLTVANDDPGRRISVFQVGFTTSGPIFTVSDGAGWHASAKGGGGFEWSADSPRFELHSGESLSGFIVRHQGIPACPANFVWVTFDKKGRELDSGSGVAPCP